MKKSAARPPDGSFDRARELARHELAERKFFEEEMLNQIDSEFAESIGGVVQRLEWASEAGNVTSGFTRDDRSYLDDAQFSVSPGQLLGPIPIVEKMAAASGGRRSESDAGTYNALWHRSLGQ